MKSKPWFLYLIECRDGSVYTGITVSVAARYAAHARGQGARYTRSHPPLRLLATLDYPNRSRASQAECRVKALSATEKRAYALTIALAAAGARSD
jgi:putative endonuclease